MMMRHPVKCIPCGSITRACLSFHFPAPFVSRHDVARLLDDDPLIHEIHDQNDDENDEKHCNNGFAAIPAGQYPV